MKSLRYTGLKPTPNLHISAMLARYPPEKLPGALASQILSWHRTRSLGSPPPASEATIDPRPAEQAPEDDGGPDECDERLPPDQDPQIIG